MANHPQKIIIVGAGLVGTSIALGLKDQPVSIEILENQPSNTKKQTTQDTRPLSLSYGSHLTLEKLGIWQALKSNACPINTVHVSEKGRFGATRITAAEQKVSALGYVVPFGELQSAIFNKVSTQSNVTLTTIDAITHIDTQTDKANLTAQINEKTVLKSADLLIAADGTKSTCRQLLGIATATSDNNDTAMIFELSLNAPHEYIAYERFTKMGVLAMLPLHDKQQARLVWSLSERIKQLIATWDSAQTLTFIQSVFEGRVRIAAAKKTASYPLKTILAETQTQPRFVLMGNAAHTIYPIAAQGFNLGLAGATTLTNTLKGAIKNNASIGESSTLKTYIDKITPHQQAIIKLTNELTPLFELQLPFAGCARGLGLLAMDLINPLKNRLAKSAMGMRFSN